MAAAAQYSSFWTRLGALVVDWVIVGVVGGLLGAILAVPLVGALAAIAIPGMDASGDLSDEAAAAVAITAALGILVIVGVLGLANLLYFVLFTGIRGQTPGKMLVGIKVVDQEGRAPGIGRAIMREIIGKFVSALAIYIGYLWALWDPQSQTWHDKIAGTYVVPVGTP
ncbi:MAG: RDD family protein [Chloroflexi bacterium]|nr:RDD family protein [Chloroflexota bacterium]